ncbi:hypothetical protein PENTCL1PPCAC_21197, partial [Pristionchus entomophagus]
SVLVHVLRRDSLDWLDVHLVVGYHGLSLLVQRLTRGGLRRPYVAVIDWGVCRSSWAVEGFLEGGDVLYCSQYSVKRWRMRVSQNLEQCTDGRRRVFAPYL